MSNALTTARVIVNHYATDSYMKDDEKIKAIRLNISFIEQYPEFFTDVMQGPVSIFFGMVVRAKAYSLKTEYDLSLVDVEELNEVKMFVPERAFTELASHWRLLKAEGNTVIPYVPIQAVLTTNEDTFAPKLRFISRYGVIEGTR